MNLTHRAVTLSLALTPITAAGVNAQSPPPVQQEQIEKNIILFVLDDVGADKLGMYGLTPGEAYARTPRLDDLALNGIRFNNFYVNPYCSVTRASMLTGRYPFRHGIGTLAAVAGLDDCEVLLPEVLRNGFPGHPNAYRCGAFGKWHLSPLNDYAHPVRNGFHRFRGLAQGCPADCDGPPQGCWPNGVPFEPDHSHYKWWKVEIDAPATTATPFLVDPPQWSGSVVAADAINWINAQPEPFFAYVAFNAPHQPLERPPDALLSQDTRDELNAACDNGGSFDSVEESRLLYRAMLEATDHNIGEILDSLDPLTALKTVVFVVSDNGTYNFGGTMHPSHNTSHGKGTVYQWGVRVPMIVYDPMFPPNVQNQASNALVCASDIWRTIARVAGASVPHATSGFSCADTQFDSVSFYPVLQNPASAGNRTYAFSQKFTPNTATIDCRCMHERATSNALYRLIRKQVVKDGMATGCPTPCAPRSYQVDELYLVTDREEMTNLNDGSLTDDETTNLNFLRDAMINGTGSGD